MFFAILKPFWYLYLVVLLHISFLRNFQRKIKDFLNLIMQLLATPNMTNDVR
jgi:hypothetical protein